MNTIGNLTVTARFSQGRLSDLGVCLDRPLVSRCFLGQDATTVAGLVPRLYTLCAQAQSAAAGSALAAAGSRDLPARENARLWAEFLHEHFWRLLLDWPLALGLPQATEAFVTWRKARLGEQLPAATFQLLETVLLGCPVESWLERGGFPAKDSLADQCQERLAAATERDAGFPALDPAAWLACWQENSLEEPALLRPPSVAAAWRSRLHQAASAARALAAGLPYPVAGAGEGGWGIGQALTARGVLTHGVRLEEGRVAAYRVWAPTDGHFADTAGLAALLGNSEWPDGAAAKQALEWAVLALDPCLPYTIKVENA